MKNGENIKKRHFRFSFKICKIDLT